MVKGSLGAPIGLALDVVLFDAWTTLLQNISQQTLFIRFEDILVTYEDMSRCNTAAHEGQSHRLRRQKTVVETLIAAGWLRKKTDACEHLRN